jgi:hypothetical protein
VVLKHRIDPVEADVKTIAATNAELGKFIEKLKTNRAAWDKYGDALQKVHKAGSDVANVYRSSSGNLDGLSVRTNALSSAVGSISRGMADVGKTVAELSKSLERVVRFDTAISMVAGLLGVAGGLFGLAEGSSAVSIRRRMVMGLGTSYGAFNSFGLNFSRFGDGNAMLGNVFSGMYDATDPAYRALMASGASKQSLNSGDVTSQTVDLLRRLPGLFQGTPDGLVGPKAEALGLTNLLSIDAIRRYLNASPGEREQQLGQYGKDAKTLDLSPAVLLKWANFTNALDRAGLKIEQILGNKLVVLAEPLSKFSDAAVKLVDAFMSSPVLKDGVEKLGQGIEWLAKEISSQDFKRGTDQFLSGMENLIPIMEKVLDYAIGGAKLGYYGGKALTDPNYNPTLPKYLSDSLGPEDPKGGMKRSDVRPHRPYVAPNHRSVRNLNRNKLPRVQSGTGTHGVEAAPVPGKEWWEGGMNRERPSSTDWRKAGGLPSTDKTQLAPNKNPGEVWRVGRGNGRKKSLPPANPHSIRYGHHPLAAAGGAPSIVDISGQSTYPHRDEQLAGVEGFIWHHSAGRGSASGVVNTLNQRRLGVQYVMERDGTIYRTLPNGARGAHILPSEINNLSNYNTEGMEVIANDDADVTPAEVASAQRFAHWYSGQHPGVQYFGHGEVNPHHKQATEGLTIANAVRNGAVPTTRPSDPSTTNIPLTARTLRNYSGGSVDPRRPDVMDPSIRARSKGAQQVSMLNTLHRSARDPKHVIVQNNSASSTATTQQRIAFA